jgi:hypothetical protein
MTTKASPHNVVTRRVARAGGVTPAGGSAWGLREKER